MSAEMKEEMLKDFRLNLTRLIESLDNAEAFALRAFLEEASALDFEQARSLLDTKLSAVEEEAIEFLIIGARRRFYDELVSR